MCVLVAEIFTMLADGVMMISRMFFGEGGLAAPREKEG
jgi:hypothetical protein